MIDTQYSYAMIWAFADMAGLRKKMPPFLVMILFTLLVSYYKLLVDIPGSRLVVLRYENGQ